MILLHGDNQIKSREALQVRRERAKGEGKQIVVLDGKRVELAEIMQALESMGLFGDERLIILENIFSAKRGRRQEQIVEYLKGEGGEIVLWESKKVDGRRLKGMEIKNEEYKLSSEIFKLMEALLPDNQKQLIYWWEKAKQTDAPELIFFMILRQVRMMLESLGGKMSGPVWLTNKIQNQAKKVGVARLVLWHTKLYEIESGVKTGRSDLPLLDQMEMFLLSL